MTTKQHQALAHRAADARSYLARIEGRHPAFLVELARTSALQAQAALDAYLASRTPAPTPAPVAPAQELVTGFFARSLGGRMEHLVADRSRLVEETTSGQTYLVGRYTAVCGRSYRAQWTTERPQSRADVCPHCLAAQS